MRSTPKWKKAAEVLAVPVVFVVILAIVGWIRGDPWAVPKGVLWMIEYTLGMKPE